MKKLIPLTFLLLLSAALCAQATIKTAYSVDENSTIKDSTGRQITKLEFYEAVVSGNYQFKPIKDKNGQIKEYLLIRCDKALNNTKIHFTSSSQCAPTTALQIGQLAPEFSGADMTDSIYDFNYFKGRKVVVLNFWFTKCKPCIEELPDLNRIKERYKDRADIVFIAPTFDFADAIDSFRVEHPFNYAILPEAYESIKNYKVIAYPLNVIIDFNGRIAYVSAGGLPGIEYLLDRKIKELLDIRETPQEHFTHTGSTDMHDRDSMAHVRLMARDSVMRELNYRDSVQKAAGVNDTTINVNTKNMNPAGQKKEETPDPQQPPATPAIKPKDLQ